MKLEKILPEDFPELVEMAREAHTESKYHWMEFSEKQVIDTFQEHISNENNFGVKVVSDCIVGFFLGGKSGMVFTDQEIGLETTYWIRPEKRGQRGFFLLLHYFKSWCRERYLTPFLMPHFGEDNTKVYSALEGLGFKQVGRIYSGSH